MKIILASGSPRRAKILRDLGVAFEIVKTDAPEVNYGDDPERTVRENALAKGNAVHSALCQVPNTEIMVLARPHSQFNESCVESSNAYPPNEVSCEAGAMRGVTQGRVTLSGAPSTFTGVLSADTIVWFNGRIYGKPRDLDEAKEFLRELSGQMHTVFTGVAFNGEVRVVKSGVKFRELSEAMIDDYVARVKPTDRAGAYDIDESGDLIVESWTGSYENIMGLPVEPVKEWLRKERGKRDYCDGKD